MDGIPVTAHSKATLSVSTLRSARPSVASGGEGGAEPPTGVGGAVAAPFNHRKTKKKQKGGAEPAIVLREGRRIAERGCGNAFFRGKRVERGRGDTMKRPRKVASRPLPRHHPCAIIHAPCMYACNVCNTKGLMLYPDITIQKNKI